MIQTIEELSANAWPSLNTILYDGWVLRFANGYTRRANSILPLYPSRLPLSQKITACEGLYRLQRLPVIFKLAGRNESRDLHTLLLEQGYQAEADTSVQTADIRAWAYDISPDVRICTVKSQEWDQAFQSMNGLREDQQESHSKILAAILHQMCYASIVAEGQMIGCALGVLQDGFLGIFDVIVHSSYRRLGCGERLMQSLMAWGKQQGGHTAYLQVMLNNPPALSLYTKLGFQEQYQYWYCVKKS